MQLAYTKDMNNIKENKVKIYCHPAFELVEVILTLEESNLKKINKSINFKNKSTKHLYTFHLYSDEVFRTYNLFLDLFNKFLPTKLIFSIYEETFFDTNFKLNQYASHIEYKTLSSPKEINTLLEDFYLKTKKAQDRIFKNKDAKSFFFSLGIHFFTGEKTIEFSLKTKFRRTFPYV